MALAPAAVGRLLLLPPALEPASFPPSCTLHRHRPSNFVAARSSDRGYKEPAWESQSQIAREREPDHGQHRFNFGVEFADENSAAEDGFYSHAPQSSPRRFDSRARFADERNGGSVGSWQPNARNRHARWPRGGDEVYGDDPVAEDASPQFHRNLRPARWQQESWEGRNGRETRIDKANAGKYDKAIQEERSAMSHIVKKLRSIREQSDASEQKEHERRPYSRTAQSLSLPRVKLGLLNAETNANFPWEAGQEAEVEEPERRARPPTQAELTIPPLELKRLRALSLHLQYRIKIGRHGVTDNIVIAIKERWCTCEVVKVKCEGTPGLTMKRIHEELELKTGGLVIWRAGTAAVVYRGRDYGQPMPDRTASRLLDGLIPPDHGKNIDANSDPDEVDVDDDISAPNLDLDIPRQTRISNVAFNASEEYEMEVENILKDLGPRFEEWRGSGPIPVDADLLPVTIDNYRPPLRLLPCRVNPKLRALDITNLRRLTSPLPPHLVFGRNRASHGLAAAIVRIWEKSEIAKITLKRGLLNTDTERIAEDIKRLTGGVLLARDKKSITFYRGKDFLPQELSAALTEREAVIQNLQEEEERARAERSIAVHQEAVVVRQRNIDADGELNVEPSWVQLLDSQEKVRIKQEAAKARRVALLQHIERKLAAAQRKKQKAQEDLEKVEQFLKPLDQRPHMETITEEERFMLRKLGLKMKPFLLLGKRGVFDGVILNMHLHWKYRALVKIIVKEKDPIELQETARMLEYESGGILVAVQSTSKGQAIIVYRGRNYERPPELRPANLLTKRKALERSIEIQRRAGLSRSIRALEEEISKMKANLRKAYGTEAHDWEDSGDLFSEDQELEDQQGEVPLITGDSLSKYEATPANAHLDKEELKRLSVLGPIYRAKPLTSREKLELEKEALCLSKAAHFHMGKSDSLTEVAKDIRMYFLDHAFANIKMKDTLSVTSMQFLVRKLEDLTGGVVVSDAVTKIVLYRGWLSVDKMPTSDMYDTLSAEMYAAFKAKKGEWDDGLVDDDSVVNKMDASNNERKEDTEADNSGQVSLERANVADAEAKEENDDSHILGTLSDFSENGLSDFSENEADEDRYQSLEM